MKRLLDLRGGKLRDSALLDYYTVGAGDPRNIFWWLLSGHFLGNLSSSDCNRRLALLLLFVFGYMDNAANTGTSFLHA